MIVVLLNSSLAMIMASLIIVLDKVRITDGALIIILCGSWTIGTIGQGQQRVNAHTQVIRSEVFRCRLCIH